MTYLPRQECSPLAFGQFACDLPDVFAEPTLIVPHTGRKLPICKGCESTSIRALNTHERDG
jgi:hypothetical protein